MERSFAETLPLVAATIALFDHGLAAKHNVAERAKRFEQGPDCTGWRAKSCDVERPFAETLPVVAAFSSLFDHGRAAKQAVAERTKRFEQGPALHRVAGEVL